MGMYCGIIRGRIFKMGVGMSMRFLPRFSGKLTGPTSSRGDSGWKEEDALKLPSFGLEALTRPATESKNEIRQENFSKPDKS